MEMRVTVTIGKESNWFVAQCDEYRLKVKSITIEDALSELQRKLSEYLQDEHPSIKTSILFVIKMPV